MSILYLDFETRSACDLKACGSFVYASHPTTQVLCASYAIDDGPVKIWNALSKEPIPSVLRGDGITKVVGHNFANFDRLICKHILKVDWPLHMIDDTMCQAYAMGLPGSLDAAAQAVGLVNRKDMRASRIMLQLAQPRTDSPLTWYEYTEFPEKFEILHEYAKKDVEATRELYKRTLKLSAFEHKVFELDMKMNSRGMPLDVSSLKKALKVVEEEKRIFDEKIRELTNNAVATANAVGQLMDWLKFKEVETESVGKSNVAALLAKKKLPKVVKEVLLIRQESAKASTAKLQAMLNRANSEGRAQGGFQYSGANTRRWAGRGFQPQNFARGEAPDGFWEALKEDAVAELFLSPMETISKSMRGFIKAPEGHKLMGADFSAIEARGLAWLAGQEEVLKIFRGEGKIYEFAASQIYKVPLKAVTPEQRQIGKVAVLALGYGGGANAFLSMAKNYGVIVGEEQANDIKTKWRERNPNIVNYWYALERAAMNAVRAPGNKVSVGPKGREVTYLKKGSFLWCSLPSKGTLCYPYPELKPVTTPWGETREGLTYMTVNSLTRKWSSEKTYGGSLAENITQSLCRDVLAEAMLRLEENGFKVIATIHDEVICEGLHDQKLSELVSIMEEVPAWAKDFPLKAEGWEGDRYGS